MARASGVEERWRVPAPGERDHDDPVVLRARLTAAHAEIDALRREKQFLLAEQDRFIRMLLDDHAAELALVREEVGRGDDADYQDVDPEPWPEAQAAAPTSGQAGTPARVVSMPPPLPAAPVGIRDGERVVADLEAIGREVTRNSDRPPAVPKVSGTYAIGALPRAPQLRMPSSQR